MAIVELTADNFEEEVAVSEGTVLVDFWAAWCGPCRMLSPIVDEIAEENHPGLKVCKCNVDEQPALAQKFQVMSIPSLLVFKDGQLVQTSVGSRPKQDILKMLGL